MSANLQAPEGGLPVPIRSAEVEGRQLVVFDGLLAAPDLARYVELLRRAPFTRTEIARPETAEYRHWASEMALSGMMQLPLWHATDAAVRAMRPDRRYRPYRAYTNYASYGDMLFTHTDCQPDHDELTALWFLCETWDPEWGGETVFFDSQVDAQVIVAPRPGRLVIFDGAIRHVGKPPNRICYAPRFTFAVKLERTQQ